MPQTQTNTIIPGEQIDDSAEYDNGSFGAKFDEIVDQFEELNDPELQERIKASGHEIIETLKIRPEMFDSPAHALLFTAIAKRHAERASEDAAEAEFALDAATLLALKKSDRYEEMEHLIDADRLGIDEERHEAVMDSFTDVELSARLSERLPQFVSVARERLGVTNENEDPFRVRVLNIGGAEANFHGMSPRMPQSMIDNKATPEEEEAFWAKRNPFVEYRDQMIANTTQFKEELNMTTDLPAAFVTTVNGERTMCIPSPIARALLEPEVVIVSPDYSFVAEEGENSDEGRTISTLGHEYVHTQGGLGLDDDVFFGIALEELRAENQASSNRGYFDMKQYLRVAVGPVTGFNFDAYFEANEKGGSKDVIFADIASKIGLDAMLEVAVLPPREYVSDSRVLSEKVSEQLGGYAGVANRLYDSCDKDAAHARMDQVARRMTTILDDLDPWFFMMRRAGLNEFADMYTERVEAIKKEAA